MCTLFGFTGHLKSGQVVCWTPYSVEGCCHHLSTQRKRTSLAHHVAEVHESNRSPNCERQHSAENAKTTLCMYLCERNTTKKPKEVHQANMNKNRYRPDKRNYSWYSEHTAPRYDSFQQFRNEHGFLTDVEHIGYDTTTRMILHT